MEKGTSLPGRASPAAGGEPRKDRFHYLKKFSPWCIDKIFPKEDKVCIKGWSYGAKPSSFGIRCNGERPFRHDYSRRRKDLPRLFPFWEDGNKAGFECEFFAEVGKPLLFEADEGGRSKGPLSSYHYLETGLPVPPERNVERVSGSTLRGAFLLEGYSAYRKIRHILEKDLVVDLRPGMEVLDWGCGCGRLSRYFVQDDFSLRGADVDSDNLSWCKSKLGIETVRLEPEPSGTLAKANHDLVIGISVMTHLDERLQLEWLAELYDALRPGGHALLSTHGISSALRVLPEDAFAEFLDRGFLDCGHNGILNEVVKRAEFYKDTFATKEFVLENWQDRFRVERVYESIIGNNQDLVVLKKSG